MLRLRRLRRWLIAVACLCNSIVWECSPTLWSQEPATPKPAEQPGAQVGYGGGAGMGGYGGEGGGYGSGMMGGGGLPLKFMILEGENEAGNEPMKVRTASRVLRFSYQLSSLKPQDANTGYGGGGYGGEGGYGGGGYAGGGYGGDMYGGGTGGHGMGGPGMGGPGMGGPGMGGMYGDSMGMGGYGGMGGGITTGGPAGTKSSREPVITIWAYVFDQDKENNRTKIELLIYPPPKPQAGSGAMFPGGAGIVPGSQGMGMGTMVGGEMGMASIPRFVRLASLMGPPKGPQDKYHLTQAEFKIVANTIKQKIWKADVVKQLNAEQGNAAETEQFLKQLLTEEYETQLVRQEIEVESIQQRISQLKEEIARRRTAKDRVIDVQLGRIVLEAQGLLGK